MGAESQIEHEAYGFWPSNLRAGGICGERTWQFSLFQILIVSFREIGAGNAKLERDSHFGNEGQQKYTQRLSVWKLLHKTASKTKHSESIESIANCRSNYTSTLPFAIASQPFLTYQLEPFTLPLPAPVAKKSCGCIPKSLDWNKSWRDGNVFEAFPRHPRNLA